MARALHALHQQNTVHLDLKPANVLFRGDGTAMLLDFGLSCHAHYPDLLAEQLRKAVGSPAWIAPEQVVGVRGDPRSDIFAVGVMLYQLCTGHLPFGAPQTAAGLRQRLWVDPIPPRKTKPDLPPWLQEVVMRCLEPEAAQRYPSAAHLAFDLTHPQQVTVTARGNNVTGTKFSTHFKRWLKAAGMHYKPSPMASQQIEEVPIVMVAVPHVDVTDATLYSLRQAVARSLGTRPGARLACVTVISSGLTSSPRRRKERIQCAPAIPDHAAPMGTTAGPPGSPNLVPRAGDRRCGAGLAGLCARQPRQRHRHGCSHPWPENAALCRHRAHQGSHGRALHHHPGQAITTL
jgi:serine/threonine protein kinase